MVCKLELSWNKARWWSYLLFFLFYLEFRYWKYGDNGTCFKGFCREYRCAKFIDGIRNFLIFLSLIILADLVPVTLELYWLDRVAFSHPHLLTGRLILLHFQLLSSQYLALGISSSAPRNSRVFAKAGEVWLIPYCFEAVTLVAILSTWTAYFDLQSWVCRACQTLESHLVPELKFDPSRHSLLHLVQKENISCASLQPIRKL